MLDICTIHDYPIKYYREFQTISIEGSIFLINSQSPPEFFSFLRAWKIVYWIDFLSAILQYCE